VQETARPAIPEGLVTEVLEVLMEHGQRDEPVALALLVERLPVSAAHITAALDRLIAQGDVMQAGAPGDAVELTAEGVRRAELVVRRHRLTERLLADVIGLDWWKVHHEAQRWEGALTEETEQRLLVLLGDPGSCPHGNPIPGSANLVHHPDAVALSEAPIGPVHVVRISEMLEADAEALQLLQACGFLPGRDAELKARDGGWVQVAGTIHDAALPPHVTTHTYVAPR
jgi:DtxR family transcriptional regulator, Mn-dependent transcriptional regulator